MRSTYQTQEAVVALLIAAQTPSALPFDIPTEVNIFDYDPGDFRYDSEVTNDGVYIYFDESNFDDGDIGEASQGHKPNIFVDIYTSQKAQKIAGTGEVTFSVKVAADAMKALVIAFYQGLMHAQFEDLLNSQIISAGGGGTWKLSDCHIAKPEHIGTMRLRAASKTITCTRFHLQVNVTEIVGTDAGTQLVLRTDSLKAYRKADDQGAPP